jgi:hypothetical protein
MPQENYASTKPRKLQDALERVEDAATFLREAIKIAREADLDAPIQPVLDRIGTQRTNAIFAIEDAEYILANMANSRDNLA